MQRVVVQLIRMNADQIDTMPATNVSKPSVVLCKPIEVGLANRGRVDGLIVCGSFEVSKLDSPCKRKVDFVRIQDMKENNLVFARPDLSE